MEQLTPHVYGTDPVTGDGLSAFRCLHIDLHSTCSIAIRILSTNSPYKQGIALSLRGEPAFHGTALLNGQPLATEKKRLVHVVPAVEHQEYELVLEPKAEKGRLLISSASDILGDYPGMLEKIAAQTRKPLASLPAESWISGFSGYSMYGNSLIPEVLSPNIIRCHCCDHVKDDHYNNMVFDMEIRNPNIQKEVPA